MTKKGQNIRLVFFADSLCQSMPQRDLAIVQTKEFSLRCGFDKFKRTMQHIANLRLLQSADMFSGQFRSLDMIAVDLGSELQIVPSPDKSSVDSPPAKAACR